MSAARLGLAVIARDEQDTLPRLLRSIEGAFDQVVLVDTGSTDRTVDIFQAWADGQDGLITTVDRFDWCDDFAAARRHADSLFHPSITWLAWADCDDELHGAQNLRALAEQAPPDLAGLVCDYDYAQDQQGRCVCRLRRERLVRRGMGTWEGRVHEAQALTGPVQVVPASVVEWRHRKPLDHGTGSNDRNLRILRRWVRDEPDNPRVLLYLGTEELTRGRVRPAIRWLRRYLKGEPGWTEERAQVHRKLAIAYIAAGEPRKAVDTALEALRLMPQWPDSALSLAEAHYELREPEKAIHWATVALAAGAPDTMLIINPLDYTVQPLVVLAGAHAALGQIGEAIVYAERALAQWPDHPALADPYRRWLAQRKRTSTVESFLAAADVLVAHDEQIKALQVLESVPHYVTDDPRVVDARSLLRERIRPLADPDGYLDRYRGGGEKPEALVEDDQTALQVAGALPRCGFLLRTVQEVAA